MVRTEEGWHTLPDGVKLYTKTWLPNTPPTAHLIFVHGFSDHINAYYDLFPILSSPPYSLAIHGFDQRGWGRSVTKPSDAGLTGPTTQVLDDIRNFALFVAEKVNAGDAEKKPFFLAGHSMGGAEALTFLLSTSPSYTSPPLPQFSGVVLESPYFALHPSSQPSSIVVSVGRLAGKLLPNRQMKQKLDASVMSRDPKVCAEWVADPLCHDIGTLQGLAGMLERGANLAALSHGSVLGLTATLPCPLLLCHGDGDKVTSFDTSKALYEKLEGEKSFAAYPGVYHKMHAEPEGKGEEFAGDVGAWIVKIAQREAEEEVRRYVAGEGTENARGEVRVLKL